MRHQRAFLSHETTSATSLLLGLLAASFLAAFAAIPPAVTPAWTEVAPGVWKTTVGQTDSLTLLSAAGGSPALAVAKDAAGQWQGTVTPSANGRKWNYGEVTWTFMTP